MFFVAFILMPRGRIILLHDHFHCDAHPVNLFVLKFQGDVQLFALKNSNWAAAKRLIVGSFEATLLLALFDARLWQRRDADGTTESERLVARWPL